nr:C3a anaphylatoxin chemotactic receptor-like [Misgurnus anguillicaudatus]
MPVANSGYLDGSLKPSHWLTPLYELCPIFGTTLGPQDQTNDTTYTKSEENSSNKIFEICIYFVILVVGVIGNGLVIFVTGHKMKTTVNSIWFLNLAIADFLFITFSVYEIVATFDISLRKALNKHIYACGIFGFALNLFASVFFLTVISLDRCMCTWFVVWVQNKRTLVKARIISVFVWILAIFCSIPVGITEYVLNAENGIDALMSLYTYRFIVGFLIPFIIIASSYIAIGVRVKHLKIGKQLRPFRIISVILAFFICWFPYHVQKLCLISAYKYNWSDNAIEKLYAAFPFVDCLVYLNSCLNPILYVFMCDEYKKKLKKSLLLVFEGAFTEEHLGLRSTSLPHNSQCQQALSRTTPGKGGRPYHGAVWWESRRRTNLGYYSDVDVDWAVLTTPNGLRRSGGRRGVLSVHLSVVGESVLLWKFHFDVVLCTAVCVLSETPSSANLAVGERKGCRFQLFITWHML